MKTKIVYVLVSDETDYFYEMVLLSLYSFRLYHPKDTVESVMDEATYERLVDKNATILNDVTPIVVSIPSEYSQMQRSRYLKTQLRQIVKGDFLYLDCDTLVCDSLEEIDYTVADVAMASDLTRKRFPISCSERFKQAGFNGLEDEPYYNSGVFFSRENDIACEFFDKWHCLWKESVSRGVSQDQPALCQANVYSSYIVKELDVMWNSQLFFVEDVEHMNSTKVFHYFTNKENTLRYQLFEHIRRVGEVNGSSARVARNPLTMGYAVFSMSDMRADDYIFSDLLSVYDGIPQLFRLLVSISHRLVTPIKIVSRLKNILRKR